MRVSINDAAAVVAATLTEPRIVSQAAQPLGSNVGPAE
jgi:hypothetical protein